MQRSSPSTAISHIQKRDAKLLRILSSQNRYNILHIYINKYIATNVCTQRNFTYVVLVYIECTRDMRHNRACDANLSRFSSTPYMGMDRAHQTDVYVHYPYTRSSIYTIYEYTIQRPAAAQTCGSPGAHKREKRALPNGGSIQIQLLQPAAAAARYSTIYYTTKAIYSYSIALRHTLYGSFI